MRKGYGAVGIPLYVFYRPGESQPLIQESLTRASLLEELDKIKAPPPKTASTSDKAASKRGQLAPRRIRLPNSRSESQSG